MVSLVARLVGPLCGLCLTIYGLSLAALSPAGFPNEIVHGSSWPYVIDQPLGEDAFYALTVAWNVAAGDGIVYNQHVPTAGFQPLVTFTYAGLAWVTQLLGGDKFLYCRLVLLFNMFVMLAFAHLAGALAQRISLSGRHQHSLPYWTAFTLVCTSCDLFNWFGYGLETAVYVSLLCWIIRASLDLFDLDHTPGLGPWLPVIAGSGLAVVVRTDYPVLLVAFLGSTVFQRPRLARHGGLTVAITLLALLPWVLYTLSATGSLVQSSALAQAGLSSGAQEFCARLFFAGYLVARQSVTFVGNAGFVLGQRVEVTIVALAAILASLYWYGGHRVKNLGRPATDGHACALGCWAVAFIGLGATYAFYSKAYWFYGRYMLVALSLTIPVLSAILARALGDLRASVRLTALVVLLVAVASFPFGVWNRYHRGVSYYEQPILAGVIQRQHPNELVGAFQSGVIGFFNENVVNLDGKMNATALASVRSGSLGRYIDATGVTLIVDWAALVDSYMSSPGDAAYLVMEFQCTELPIAATRGRTTQVCRRKAEESEPLNHR